MTESEAKKNLETLEKFYRISESGSALHEVLINFVTLENLVAAIQALEKQIAKKPIIKQGKYCNAYHCPVCNGYIRSTNTRIEVILEENIFCGVCGQKLNWESDEE